MDLPDNQAVSDVFEVMLPFPPSVNHYWHTTVRRKRGGVPTIQRYISEAGKSFRANAIKQCVLFSRGTYPVDGRIGCEVILAPPDKRKRDVDNYTKGVLDALEAAGVFLDDNQVKEIVVRMTEPVAPGMTRVRLWQLNDTDEPE